MSYRGWDHQDNVVQSRGGGSLAYRGEKDGTPILNHDPYRKKPGLNPIHGTYDVTQ